MSILPSYLYLTFTIFIPETFFLTVFALLIWMVLDFLKFLFLLYWIWYPVIPEDIFFHFTVKLRLPRFRLVIFVDFNLTTFVLVPEVVPFVAAWRAGISAFSVALQIEQVLSFNPFFPTYGKVTTFHDDQLWLPYTILKSTVSSP